MHARDLWTAHDVGVVDTIDVRYVLARAACALAHLAPRAFLNSALTRTLCDRTHFPTRAHPLPTPTGLLEHGKPTRAHSVTKFRCVWARARIMNAVRDIGAIRTARHTHEHPPPCTSTHTDWTACRGGGLTGTHAKGPRRVFAARDRSARSGGANMLATLALRMHCMCTPMRAGRPARLRMVQGSGREHTLSSARTHRVGKAPAAASMLPPYLMRPQSDLSPNKLQPAK